MKATPRKRRTAQNHTQPLLIAVPRQPFANADKIVAGLRAWRLAQLDKSATPH